MKLISYQPKSSSKNYRIGAIHGESVIDIQAAYQALLVSRNEGSIADELETILPAEPARFFAIGLPAIEKAEEAYQHILKSKEELERLNREDIKLGNPISAPGKVICVGKNYEDHVAEMQGDIPEFPVLFAKFNNALIGPEDAIETSDATKKLDYEVELAFVIGREATKVKREDALSYIAGYTIVNDTSARDLQKRTPQWLQGKTLDRSTPIGPWVVTADEIDDPGSLSIRSFVNGVERQASNTSHLIFDIPFLVEFISNLITLNPGDIILTGTPDGVGFAMDPPQFLKDGDIVTLEIEKIGRMENRVVHIK
ncbi:fumarylacetoacetate hydrolase family protein [Oceanobacillus chungangensis]|uniref:FAA hydrolase family protein n=1 Tax=Oceanobacillus chungangensis TaxID=1229152 RepID=A0A3D8PPX4_9BACI|nr:fumarylacetoacetate hydrolase family protein [Oceanobacillus chungangensis]RDW17085.1 FAA hydrolase family protein [Oceanobacillus chungangensis]